MDMDTGIGTLLHLAIGKGLLDLVKLLTKDGADQLIKDPGPKSALDRECMVIMLLLLSFLALCLFHRRYDFTDKAGFHYQPVPLAKVAEEVGTKSISAVEFCFSTEEHLMQLHVDCGYVVN
jgi:hypothetical protein